VKVDLGELASATRTGILSSRYIFEHTQLLKIAEAEPHVAADAAGRAAPLQIT
jgi:hypothetical protein